MSRTHKRARARTVDGRRIVVCVHVVLPRKYNIIIIITEEREGKKNAGCARARVYARTIL